jgi:hypothetical protein
MTRQPQFPPANVEVLEFKYSAEREANFTTLEKQTANELLKLIDFAHPFEPGGVPAAVVTGTFRLSLTVQGKKIERQFTIYNDELVQDQERTEVFYRVDRRLSERLRALRQR